MSRLKCDRAAPCNNCNRKGRPSLCQYISPEHNSKPGATLDSADNDMKNEDVNTAASRTADMTRRISCLEKIVMFLKHQSSCPGRNHFDQWIEQHTVPVSPAITPWETVDNTKKRDGTVTKPGNPQNP